MSVANPWMEALPEPTTSHWLAGLPGLEFSHTIGLTGGSQGPIARATGESCSHASTWIRAKPGISNLRRTAEQSRERLAAYDDWDRVPCLLRAPVSAIGHANHCRLTKAWRKTTLITERLSIGSMRYVFSVWWAHPP